MASEMRLFRRWKSEMNIAGRNEERVKRSQSLGDVQYKKALDEQMRDHLRLLTNELNSERRLIAEIKHERVCDLRAAREEEIRESNSKQNDLIFKLTLEKDKEIEKVAKNAKEYTMEKLSELEERKNEELRRQRRDFDYEKEQLINALAGKFRDEARNEIGYDFENARRQMESDYYKMASENKRLREDLKTAKYSDENKAEEIRKLYREYNKAMSKLKRDASQDSKRQIGEIRELQKIISELEKKIGLESGTCLRLQMEKESVDEAFSRLKLADSWEKRGYKSSIKGFGGIDIEAAYASSFAPNTSARSHNAPERILQRKNLELTSLIRRLDESNQKLAARNQELVDEIENMKNEREPEKQKMKRLGAKNMDLVQGNRRKDERIIEQQEEILSLKEKLNTYDEIIKRKDKEISRLKTKVQVHNETEIQREDMDNLQSALQEQLQIIYELRQQSVDKDRRIDVLRERLQKMQHKKRRKEKGRKSTSPDSLNHASADEDNLSTSSDSFNDVNFRPEFEATSGEFNMSNLECKKYQQLMMEKVEIERAYTMLQSQVGGNIDPERMQLEVDVLRSDLLVSQAKIHNLESQLEVKQSELDESRSNRNDDRKDDFKEEKERLRKTNKALHEKLIFTESEVLSKNIDLKRLNQDLADVEEQRDLFEFRIAEVEEKFRAKSPESWQTIHDDKIALDQEIEEIECDAVSVKIALKELEINRQNCLHAKERKALETALDLIEHNEKELKSAESREKSILKRFNDLEFKYKDVKDVLAEKELKMALMTEEKCKQQELELLNVEDLFQDDENQFENNNEGMTGSDNKQLLNKANESFPEMDITSHLMKQKLERYESEKEGELSGNEMKILASKVAELEEVKNRLEKVESLNIQLESQLEESKIEKKARDLVDSVVLGLPNSIAEEIKNLDDEKRTLLVELEELKSRSKEPALADLKSEVVVRQEQFTQTDAIADDVPWHKYMSPRSERSLSRNDSGLTSRLQTDEGTQTPRIRDLDEPLGKLIYEDYLSSAPASYAKSTSNTRAHLSFSNRLMLQTPELSFQSDISQSSIESLFQFADRIVKEATIEAKQVVREKLNASESSETEVSLDETLTPLDAEEVKGPGQMIDMYMKHYDMQEKTGVTTAPCDQRSFDALEILSSDKSQLHELTLHGASSMNIEFDPHHAETSSVDENSKQTPHEEPCRVTADVGTQYEALLENFMDGDVSYESGSFGAENKAAKKRDADDKDRDKLSETKEGECSRSVASDDIVDLLAYGEMLREEHGEKTILKPNEEVRVDYDESFAVENNNSTIDSRDVCGNGHVMSPEDVINVDLDEFPHIPQSETELLVSNVSRNKDQFMEKCEVSFGDRSAVFDDWLLRNHDNYDCRDCYDYDPMNTSRLNQTDGNSDMSFSTMGNRIHQLNQSSNSLLQLPQPIRRQSQHGGKYMLNVSEPRIQSSNRLRSRSLSPRRGDHKEVGFFRSASVGKGLSQMQNAKMTCFYAKELDEYSNERILLSDTKHFLSSKAMLMEGEKIEEYSMHPKKKIKKTPPAVLPRTKLDNNLKNLGDRNRRSEMKNEKETEKGISKKELNMLREECASLERQIKNKDNIMRTMKAELKEEVENIALLEKKEKLIQEKAESNAQLTQNLQRCQKELDARISEINRKDMEISQLKTEVKNLEISKKHTEQTYTEVQVQVNKLEVIESKLAHVQEEHDTVLLKNRELIDRIKYLEVAEKEFIELERNVIDLQEQLQDLESIEAHRDDLLEKFQNLKRQRDEFLEKGRMVEEERNDFLRTNQTMEQRFEDFKKKYSSLKNNCGDLNRKILILEREKKELESKMLDVQNDRSIMQTALGKLEVERDDLIREVKEVTSEKYILERKLTEMDEMMSDHDHLEEGFHSLRLKLGEITRQRDDAEMLIPSLKAKIGLLKKACREKDESVTRYIEELKQFKHNSNMPAMKGRSLEHVHEQPTRSRGTSSYFTENRREVVYNTKKNLDYEVSDESVVYSEDDPSIIDEGSIIVDYRNQEDRRRQGMNRTVAVYDRRVRPSDRQRVYRALYDYDPYKSSASHHPEKELRLKEGDYVTVYGEMDIDGYLEAEIDGQSGLIPSIYVEESNDEGNYSHQRSIQHGMKESTTRSTYGVRQRKFVCIHDYDPYTMGRDVRPEQQLSLRKGDVITIIGDIDVDGYYTAELNGRSGLIPSTFVRELGGSRTGDMSSFGATSQGREQKSHSMMTTENRTMGTRTIGTRNGSTDIMRDDVIGPPFPPSNLKVLRIVSNDSLILTWNMPPIDKNGKSNGASVTGYKIWVNGKPAQDVKKYLMTKALISGLNLRDHLEFDIQTVAENGFCSEKSHFNISGADSLRNPIYEDFFLKAVGNYRTFIALFDYDPYKSSPNQNPSLELSFNEGDLIKVYDTSRSDGFYQAEVRGKKGLVPSNFIEEISMPEGSYSRGSEMYSTRSGNEAYSRTMQASRSSYGHSSSQQQQQQQQQNQRSSTVDYEKRSSLSSTNGGRRRKMVASYDYDPLKQSPSKDKSKELSLRKGQYVTVIGDMRPDGFYFGEIDGRQGFVPGDFLEPSKDDDSESRRVQFASGNEAQ